MKHFFTLLLLTLGLTLAQGFSGTFQNTQDTGQLVLQQATDNSLQGTYTNDRGSLQIQGSVDSVNEASGIIKGPDVEFAFQAKLSQDGLDLEMLVAPLGEDGQPDYKAVQQLNYRRTQASAQNPLENPRVAKPIANPENPLTPAPQGFLESFDSPQGEFASYLLIGPDQDWNGQLLNGSYQLSNTGDPGAVKYMYATALTGIRGALSSYKVSVDVAGRFPDTEYSQAGLMFHFDEQNRFYYAFLIKGGNTVSVVVRDVDGFQELASVTSEALQIGQVNRLSIVTEGSVLRLLVNNEEAMRIESTSLLPGGIGILAAGTGDFVFDNFAVGF